MKLICYILLILLIPTIPVGAQTLSFHFSIMI